MKKYKFFVLILLMTLITSIGVNATTVDGDYSYTTYDNEGYDLITGVSFENDDMSRTNRVEIARDSIDDKLYFNDDNFSHVLFFNSSNIYIGYGNGDGSTRELSSYIGDVIPDGGGYSIVVPENARKFALMNYNYGAHFRDDIIYENEDIDNIAIYGLSYRDLFEGNDNLLFNTTHDDLSHWYDNVSSAIEGGVRVLTPYGNATSLHMMSIDSTNPLNILENHIYYSSFDTLFPDTFTNVHVDLTPYPFTYPPHENAPLLEHDVTTTEMTTLKGAFIAPYDMSSIYYNYFKDSIITVDEKVYIDNTYLYDVTNIFNGDFSEWETTVNLFDLTDINNDVSYRTDLSYVSNGIKVTNNYGDSTAYVSHRMYLEPNTVYTLKADSDKSASFHSSINVYNYDVSTFLGADDTTPPHTITFTTPADGGVAILFYVNSYLNNYTEYTNIQLELGSTATDYVPHVDYDSLITEFETMKLYYDTYKDAVDEISYNDIYANNLIVNGDFSNGLDNWLDPFSAGAWSSNVTNNELEITALQNGLFGVYQNILVYNDIYYLGVDVYAYQNNDITLGNVSYNYDLDLNSWNFISKLYSSSTSVAMRLYTTMLVNELIIFDDIVTYNLTEIFGYVEDDITATWIEARYAEWVDPLADVYPNYYPASTLILNTVYYKYDDTPPAPADFQTSFDDKLVSIGVDTPQEELFGAFLIMIVVAVLLGLKFKSVAIVMIAELSLIFIFTVLGWFSLWFILVLALTFVLLILLKALKGGQK